MRMLINIYDDWINGDRYISAKLKEQVLDIRPQTNSWTKKKYNTFANDAEHLNPV